MADDKKEAPEIVKNCAGCKKPVKRAKRYYRNGKYYCNYRCWHKAKVKDAESQAGAQEAAA